MKEENEEKPKTKEEHEELPETSKEEETKEATEETIEEVESEIEEETTEEPKEAEVKAEEKIEETVEAEKETLTTEEEKEAKPEKEEKREEEEIVEERIYTIPLSRAWIAPPRKRAPRAIRIIKSFVTKHMKLEARKEGEEEEEPKRLILDNKVNEAIWSRGIEKPPRKIRIRAAKDKEGNVTVYLAEGD
ncbi:MAG: 50S ribosomal protein L31e [Candidatus Bathyarchaeia archaeon]